MQIVNELAPIGSDDPFTSHHIRSIFQGKTHYKGVREKFHPIKRFSKLYSESAPDFALTYTWDTDFRKEIPEYFSNIEQMVDSNQGDEKYRKLFDSMTFWMDIFFIDQNSNSLIDDLISQSNDIYKNTPHHGVLLTFDTLRRGWCLAEIGYRAFSVQAEFRLDLDELKMLLSGKTTEKKRYSVNRMKKISDSHISFRLPQIIFGSSAYLAKDLFPFISAEVLANMKTGKKDDRPKILEILTELFGSEENFDSVIHEFASGAIQLVADGRNGVRGTTLHTAPDSIMTNLAERTTYGANLAERTTYGESGRLDEAGKEAQA